MTLLQLTLSYIVKAIFKLECYLILIVGLVMSDGVLINNKRENFTHLNNCDSVQCTCRIQNHQHTDLSKQ